MIGRGRLGRMHSPCNWIVGLLAAMVAMPLFAQQNAVTATGAVMSAPTRVHFDMTATPPVLTPEIQAMQARADRGPLPHAFPLPIGTTAVARPDSQPVGQGSTHEAAAPTAAPGTFTFFNNSSLGSTIQSQTSGLTGEPTIANSGAVVFATGNWWAAISSDGGQTFSYISPYTQFPSAFGGFCCDQMAVYDPSRDIFIWTLQYNSSGPAGAGQNIFRMAVARPSDAVAGNWWYYDFISASNTEWDFPGLCLSNDFVYYLTNRGVYASDSVNDSFAFRFPLDPLSTASGFGYNVIDFGAAGIGNLSWRCANGATDIAYFGSHNSTSQVRIMRWAENSGSLFWDNVDLSATWPNATHACPTPDGRDWCGFDDGRIKAGWVGRNMIGFLWNASAGSGFAVPYVEGVRVVEPTRAYLDRPFIWNSTLAFQYPAAAVNARGDVGIVVHGSSSSTYPAYWVGIDDDFSRDAGFGPPGWEVAFVREGTQGPNTNRWGDYFSVQPFSPNGLGWTATGTTMQGCGVAGCKETRYVVFGRERDMRGIADPPAFFSSNSATFSVGVAGSFTAMARGFPAPTFTRSGALPGGVFFDTTTGALFGTPSIGTGGVYSLTLGAVNGVLPNASQSFTLFVDEQPAITSANNITFKVGTFGTFTVVATGYPAPSFTRSGALPTGVSFDTTTGVLSGTPAAGTGGVYALTIGATNGIGTDASQSFTLTVNEAPTITSASGTTFTVGSFGTFSVVASGYPAPARSETGLLPTGVAFNSGTGVLSGTPAAGTGGIYYLTFGATNGVTPNAAQGFTLTVNQAPAIASPNSKTCVLGIACSFSVSAAGFPFPTFTRSGALPSGMSFDTTSGILSGIPGTSGTFPLTIGAVNGVAPSASQAFTLTVSPSSATTMQRTWVASYGNDANACNLAAPCRSFNRAISQTSANGEVVVLDSAGYGPATITQPVTIVSPRGVHAGVSVSSGTGIVVDAGSGARVVLRGLTIESQGGAVGIDFQSGAALYVERTSITGFTTAGLNASPNAAAAIYLRDVKIRDNATGAVFGPTPASAGPLSAEIDRTEFETNSTGLSFEGRNTTAVIRSSVVTGGLAGVVVQPSVSGAQSAIELRQSTISKNSVVALQVGSGAAGAGASAALVGTQIVGNGVGILAQTAGSVFMADCTVSENATGLSLADGTVVSVGDNRLFGNTSNGAFSSTIGKQ